MRLRIALVLVLGAALAGCGSDERGSRPLAARSSASGGSVPPETTPTVDPGAPAEPAAPEDPLTDPTATTVGAESPPAPAGASPPAAPPGGSGDGNAASPPQPSNSPPPPVVDGDTPVSSPPPEPAPPPQPAPQPAPEPPPAPAPPPGGNRHAQAWESYSVAEDGRTMTFTYYAGVEPCSVFDSVQAVEGDSTVEVTIYERDDSAPGTACIMVAVQKTATVALQAPLGTRAVVDGAKR